jgi:hypothetical protein
LSNRIFRQEAIDHHLSHLHASGDILLLPRWTRWMYWLLVAFVAAAAIFVTFVTVPEYADGNGVVTTLTANGAVDNSRLRLIAALPGRRRPSLHRGQELRVEWPGYPYGAQTAAIDAVDDRVVTPAELRATAGAAIADALQVTGPVAIVRATLPAASVDARGRELRIFDGMHGKVAIRLASERLIAKLLPPMVARDRRP